MGVEKPMLFHELYGSYYQTVSLILKDAVNGSLTKKGMAGSFISGVVKS